LIDIIPFDRSRIHSIETNSNDINIGHIFYILCCELPHLNNHLAEQLKIKTTNHDGNGSPAGLEICYSVVIES
jgi:hypothetical protein